LMSGLNAFGQGLTPDPYNIVGEYNGQYAPYMYAVEPAPGTVYPNSNRMREGSSSRGSSNFQSYVESLDGAEPEDVLPGVAARRSGIGTPYYRAYRSFDQDYGRLYRPNESADRTYAKNQNQLNTKYFDAMKEPNPRKRAQLLREYNLENLRSSRTLSTLRGAPERDSARTRAPRPLGAGAPGREPAPPLRRPSTGAGDRRVPASPYGLPSLRDRPSDGATPGTGRGTTTPPTGLQRRSSDGLGPTDPGLEPSDVLERSELFDRPSRAPAPRTPTRPLSPR
jgi:hypothetical protein